MLRSKIFVMVVASILILAGRTEACDQSPIADIADATKTEVINDTITFDGSGSHDGDEGGYEIRDYLWTFPAEASSVTGQGTDTATCQFDTPGVYVVKLKVKDDEGWWSTNDKCTVTVGPIIYVDPNAPNTPHDGSTWLKAYLYLQDALDDATSGDQIWVAEGVYRPDQDASDPCGSGDPCETFGLITDVAIYGGFAPYPASLGDRDWQDRDPDENETVLSGADHVVTGSSGTGSTALLDGFTVTRSSVAGLYNDNADPTVKNCLFTKTISKGMYNENGSAPTVTDCVFSLNVVGIYNDGSSPTVTNCTFSENDASTSGAGMHNKSSSSPVITNCTFTDNSNIDVINDSSDADFDECTFTKTEDCEETSSGIENKGSNTDVNLENCTFSGKDRAIENGSGCGLTVDNCIFSDNATGGKGAAIRNFYSTGTIDVTNSLFTGNVAGITGGDHQGGAIFSVGTSTITNSTFCGNSVWGGHYVGGGAVHGGTLINCIFWENRSILECCPEYEYAEDFGDQVCHATVTYSCIQGWTSGGTGNITDDPCFVNIFDFFDATIGVVDDPCDPCCAMEVKDASLYDPCDIIEYNNDGVERTVTSVNTTTDIVKFTPCLDSSSEKRDIIFNWGSNTDLTEDFHLVSASPCIDVGDPCGTYTGQVDMDGDNRVIDISGKGDGVVDVGMGADEYKSP